MTLSFYCPCGNFKEYSDIHQDWICFTCDKWLKEHYSKLREENLEKRPKYPLRNEKNKVVSINDYK